eukprot:CAMPEP_0184244964 /NCGR_PEP_ID=MMETSP0977-20130417/1188_1 /TAXON_ID=483370 /ORGANISM="non described non described, Strain CCMP2097" /LENGTH=131 /DNA_ID=CAMNT_0026550261 /DNA_START=291 /DNA_END=685 /DNA_ORIENTATION=+
MVALLTLCSNCSAKPFLLCSNCSAKPFLLCSNPSSMRSSTTLCLFATSAMLSSTLSMPCCKTPTTTAVSAATGTLGNAPFEEIWHLLMQQVPVQHATPRQVAWPRLRVLDLDDSQFRGDDERFSGGSLEPR